MSVTIQGNTSTVISNNSAPEGTSEIAKITMNRPGNPGD